jgi:hypothetical protein
MDLSRRSSQMREMDPWLFENSCWQCVCLVMWKYGVSSSSGWWKIHQRWLPFSGSDCFGNVTKLGLCHAGQVLVCWNYLFWPPILCTWGCWKSVIARLWECWFCFHSRRILDFMKPIYKHCSQKSLQVVTCGCVTRILKQNRNLCNGSNVVHAIPRSFGQNHEL